MKIMNFLKGITLFLIVAMLVSCGKDEEKQEYTLKNAITEYVYELGVANAGDQTIKKSETVSLNTLLSEYTYTPPIKSGTLLLTGGTSIMITATKKDIELKNFTLTVNGLSKEIGNLKIDETELHTNKNVEFISKFFERMVSEENLTVSASFSPSRDITYDDDLKITFVFKADYTYMK